MDNDERSVRGYAFRLLQEETSESDLFPDQTHEEVKNTLYNLIETSEKGITIGLEGTWGSGKSTVINFLNTAIRNSKKKTIFFSFDAWAHEGDPLRRIFLESLINEIDPENKDEYLDKLLQEISGRKKTVVVKTKKKTSKFADYLAISALLVPMGAALLSAIDYNKIFAPWSAVDKSVNYTLSFGLLFSLAPALVALWWGIFGKKDKNGKPDWALVLSNTTEDYTQDITEDGERSSIEFEKYFQKILKYSVGSEKSKKYERAIIVVDNLDRVDSIYANQLWSTLQTFFQHRRKKRTNLEDWMEYLWFIVPYDREGLSKIWIAKKDDKQIKESGNVAQSFLNKCFQVIAEVPAAVPSAWIDYTTKSVNNALESWPLAQREIVVRTYKRHSSRIEISPTPREINNFVNQVGFLGMRWGGIMSTESIALYAILRKKYPEGTLRDLLLTSADLPDDFEALGDHQIVKQELAGLLFGVAKDKGIELLLKPEIKKSISSGDGSILNDLVKLHGEAFWITWDAIKNELMPTESHSEEYRISFTKSISSGLSEYFNRIPSELANLEKIWRGTTDNWKLGNFDYTESLFAISDFSIGKPAFIDWLQRITLFKLKKLVNQTGESVFNANELQQIYLISEFLLANNKPLTTHSYPKLDANNWPIWLKALISNEISLPTVLPAKGSIEAIGGQYLASSVTLPEENLTLLLDTFSIYPNSSEWVSVITNLTTWANRTNRDLGNDLAYQLMLNLYTFNNTDSQNLIKNCVAGPAFWVRGKSESLESTPTLPLLVGCVLGSDLQTNTFLNSDTKSYWSTTDNPIEKIDHAFKTLKETNQLIVFWELARDENNHFAIEVLKTNTDSIELYSLHEAVVALNDYSWFDLKEDKGIISKLCESGAANKTLDVIKHSPVDYNYALYLLQKCGSSNVIVSVNKLLTSLDSVTWTLSFDENNYLLNCVLNNEVKLDHKYTEAFKSFFINSMNNPSDHEWQWTNFDSLLKKTVDQELLLKDLTSQFFNEDEDKHDQNMFSALSAHIINYINTINTTRLMMRTCHWIDNNAWDRIEWLNSSKLKIKEPPLEGLISRINDAHNKEENIDKVPIINTLAKIFNVTIANRDNKEVSQG